MQPVRGQIGLAMLLGALGSLATLGSLVALAWSLHQLIQQPQAWPWQALLAAAGLILLAHVLRLAAFNQSHLAAFRLERILRTRLTAHLGRVPLGYVQQQGAAALSKVIQDDVKALHIFVADSTPLYARAYVAPCITFLVMWLLDWRLALAATGVLVFGLLVVSLAMRGSQAMIQQYNTARENISTAVVEYVQAMPVVRTFDTGTSTFGRYQQALDHYREVVLRWYRMAGFSSRFSQAILNPLPTLAALLWLGAWLINQESLDPSTWLLALLLGSGMAESLLPLMSLRHLVARTQLSIHRIQEVLAAPVLPQPDRSQALQPVDASLTFEQVGFRYTDDTPEVLKDISFHAAAGSFTALVGPSGAGKSTLARLLPRFWDVNHGRILLGGVDLRQMTSATLMQQVAFVFQDTFLFADTLANNIRLGQPGATQADIETAAKAAQAHDFIMALPQGYDTQAGERGAFLSGGQRQRITIARAILQNRPLLVLDEATAFTDPENEAALMAALANLMRGKTVLMVAHRLNTIRQADQILVFDQGRLVEQGRHDTLLQGQGRYASLWHQYEHARHWTLSTTRHDCKGATT